MLTIDHLNDKISLTSDNDNRRGKYLKIRWSFSCYKVVHHTTPINCDLEIFVLIFSCVDRIWFIHRKKCYKNKYITILNIYVSWFKFTLLVAKQNKEYTSPFIKLSSECLVHVNRVLNYVIPLISYISCKLKCLWILQYYLLNSFCIV